MNPIRIGVSFDGFLPFRESLDVARQAVQAGAASLWMAEHLGYRESMTSCMAFALSFPGVRVVPTAISPYLRHPMPTAMALATLDEASPGNVALAIGVGNPMFLGESGLAIDKPIRAIRESAGMLRALWAGGPVRTEGMLHRLYGATLAWTPSAPIPIYLTPMKVQMLQLSGRIGDGVVLSGGLSADFVRQSLGIVDASRAEAGRDGPFLRSAYVYFLASTAPKAGYHTLRTKLAFLMRNRYIDDGLAHAGLPIDQAAIMAAISRRDFETANRLVPDEAVEAFTITGTAAQCRDGIARFQAAGLDEIVLIMAGDAADRETGYRVIREMAG